MQFVCTTLTCTVAVSLVSMGLFAATAEAADDYGSLTGAEQAIVRSLEVGGCPIGATPRLEAIALARTGGRNGAERHRLQVIQNGGSVGATSTAEKAAVLMRTNGRTGAERHRLQVMRNGGHVPIPEQHEEIAAGYRHGRRNSALQKRPPLLLRNRPIRQGRVGGRHHGVRYRQKH